MPEKILVIAEKPSVAADIVKILPGKFEKSKTHYESDSHIVSFAVGHLVSIEFPEEIDPKYKSWKLENLPILPVDFSLKGLEASKPQLNALQKLIRRSDVVEIVNACDAGREGELIFKYILHFVWNQSVAKKRIKRLWLQSMTKAAIKDAFAHLRNNDEMRPLEDAAMCRSESDWLIGINATRALTGFNSSKGGFTLTPCGRVQTPTLSLIVKRELARESFVPRTYFNLLSTFSFVSGSYVGKWIDPKFVKDEKDSHARADRIWDELRANQIVAQCAGKAAKVEETSKKISERSPQLYDLTSLQREANSRFGFSAKNTLGLAQALYEKHKMLTYPRTDSRCLPEGYLPTVRETVEVQTGWQFGQFAAIALEKNYLQLDKLIFNNAKISDHHAIIPTPVSPKTLSEPELKIYTMVVQRFLAVFFPPAKFLNTRRLSVVEKETFLTEGKILTEPGWKAIYGSEVLQEQDGASNAVLPTVLTPIPKGALVNCTEIEKKQAETKPPARFNEATLLSAMENSDKFVEDEALADAMKERGLGTPSTRAAIIEKLIKEKYLLREGKELVPTGKAKDLLSALESMEINLLASPEMTGEWEYKLNQILHGKFTRKQFMAEIRETTAHIVSQVRNFDPDKDRVEAPFSPINGTRYYSNYNTYSSEDGTVSIRKSLGGRTMSEVEVVALISGETIGPFSDFWSRQGKPFTASLRLEQNKIEFLFADSTDALDIEAIKAMSPLGLSPVDQAPVYETPAAYMSTTTLEGDKKKGLQISKIILGRAIAPDHIRQLLQDGRTELITGFISRWKRPFDAFLLLDPKGKISFEFPPRVKKEKKTTK